MRLPLLFILQHHNNCELKGEKMAIAVSPPNFPFSVVLLFLTAIFCFLQYYIDPSNKKFNSKPEVLRYLKNAGSGTKHTKSRKLKNINTSKHVDTSKHSASKVCHKHIL